ncbi:MAG: hypothetical protein ACXWFX_12885 [Methylobacter sp.]
MAIDDEKKGGSNTQSSINEKYYNDNILPKIESHFQPKSLLHFIFTLPFQLPFKDKTEFCLIYANHAIFFFFDKFEENTIEPIFESSSGLNIPRLRTRIESAIVSCADFSKFEYNDLYNHLVHTLNKLNGFINAYRITFEDWKTRPVTSRNLHAAIWYETRRLPDWLEIKNGPILVNQNYDAITTNLTNELIEFVHNFGGYLINSDNDFQYPHLHFADARTYLLNGFYKESIISAQTAVETKIRLIYRFSLREQGKTQDEINEIVENIPFIKMVKTKMPEILGGNWDFEDKSKPVGKWHSILYSRRNRALHCIYLPYDHEASECFVVAYEMLNYLNHLIKEKSKKLDYLYKYTKELPKYFLRGEDIKSFSID